MPIKIPNALPATETLLSENIFVMTETRALSQDIRPLKILLLNLMPTKVETETQLARLLGNTPLQVEVENPLLLHQAAQYQSRRDILGNTGSRRYARHIPVEKHDEDQIEHHIDHTGEAEVIQRPLGVALGSEDGCAEVIDHGGRHTQKIYL